MDPSMFGILSQLFGGSKDAGGVVDANDNRHYGTDARSAVATYGHATNPNASISMKVAYGMPDSYRRHHAWARRIEDVYGDGSTKLLDLINRHQKEYPQLYMPGINDHWSPPAQPNPLDDKMFDLYLNHAIEQAAIRGDRRQ